MKRQLMIMILLTLGAATYLCAQDEAIDEDAREGKVKYALILPEEKTPELVKQNEANPFGGLQDDKSKETASGEEAKISEILRSLPVVGKSSRNCVLLGDIILRKGQLVPPVLPNQSVQFLVRDIKPEKIELVKFEKKPTGVNPQVLTILTDVSPQVKQRLPGSFAGSGSKGAPVMGVIGRSSLLAEEPAKAVQRAETVAEETPPGSSSGATPGTQPPSPGSALLNLFFGNQVKEPVKSPALKPAEEDDQRENHVPKP